MQMRQEAKYWKHLSIKCAPKQDHHKEQPLYLPWELVHHTINYRDLKDCMGITGVFIFLLTYQLSYSPHLMILLCKISLLKCARQMPVRLSSLRSNIKVQTQSHQCTSTVPYRHAPQEGGSAELRSAAGFV